MAKKPRDLQRVRAKLSEWEAKAARAARDLERYRRPDLVAKASRAGRLAERKLTEYSRQERRLTKAVARQRARQEKKSDGKKYVYHPKVFYSRRHHEAAVEVSFHWRDFGQRSTEEVQDALHDLVKGKSRPELVVEAIHYGRLDADIPLNRGAEIRSFIGIVLSGNLETIGEEIRK